MSTVTLGTGDYRIALWHLALYGLAAIAEDAGVTDLRISWREERPMRPELHSPELDDERLGQIVHDHARRRWSEPSWLHQDIPMAGRARGLMSPRLGSIGDDQATWDRLQAGRHDVLDRLTQTRSLLDLRELAALGEPAYWSINRTGNPLQDDGASRWEMQPRNQGSEFVGSRLRKLAKAVAERSDADIVDGLLGTLGRDEVGADKPDSRTPTGLASPGPTDNTVAWCALWGISQLPVAMRIGTGHRPGTAATSGHIGRTRNEWFYLPVWTAVWYPARLRTILASAQLRTAATAGLPDRWRAGEPEIMAARAWLRVRGVIGIVRFRIDRFGSDSAPERRAMDGEALPTAVG
jgi:CRISPR-associated protein Csb3